MLEFDFETYNNKYISIDEKASYKDKIDVLKEKFNNEELGHWLNLNTYVQKDEFSKIKRVSEDIRNLCDVFVVIGIGGSYMGSKAVIEALSPMYNRTKPEIIFLGKNINPNEYIEVLDYIKGKEIGFISAKLGLKISAIAGQVLAVLRRGTVAKLYPQSVSVCVD